MDRKQRVKRIVSLLKKEYPDTRIALEYSNPLEILVATILSAQCTDKRVNIVTKTLFKKYRTAADYAKADISRFQQQIRSTGFYRAKANNIIKSARKIVKDFKGRVPDTMKELVALPGVARKTANIVLYSGFGKIEGIAVDTHVKRLSGRLKLSGSDDPVKIEVDLMKIVPRKDWGVFNHLLVRHGREVCEARRPKCDTCVIKRYCPYFQSR